MKRVFVDTMIFGYAAGTKVDQVAHRKPGTIKKLSGEERQVVFLIHDHHPRPPKRTDLSLEEQIKGIKKIASLATQRAIDLVCSHEVDLELLFQPLIDVMPGRLFGAPYRRIRSPLLRAEALSDSEEPSYAFVYHPSKIYEKYRAALKTYPDRFEDILREFLLFLPIGNISYQLDFRSLLTEFKVDSPDKVNASLLMLPLFEGIQDKRYRSLLKMLNANSAGLRKRANIHMDAYHLWTAECSECDFFLTTDTGILRQYKGCKLSVVTPKGLVSSIKSN